MAYDIFIFLLDVTRKSHPRYGYLSSQMKGFTYIEMYTLVRIDVAANTVPTYFAAAAFDSCKNGQTFFYTHFAILHIDLSLFSIEVGFP